MITKAFYDANTQLHAKDGQYRFLIFLGFQTVNFSALNNYSVLKMDSYYIFIQSPEISVQAQIEPTSVHEKITIRHFFIIRHNIQIDPIIGKITIKNVPPFHNHAYNVNWAPRSQWKITIYLLFIIEYIILRAQIFKSGCYGTQFHGRGGGRFPQNTK